MSIKLFGSGDLSMANDIAVEYQDDPDHSLSEFYRRSPSLPTSGEISFSDFYGTTNFSNITYEIIGGGGAGGHGDNARNQTPGGNGFPSSIRFLDAEYLALGGAGGQPLLGPYGSSGEVGQASFYGPGANVGQHPAVNHGSGGFGGRGDDDGPRRDIGSFSGQGGFPGQRISGGIFIPSGTVITIVVGSGGRRYTRFIDRDYRGGDGATGYVKLTISGIDYEFKTNSTLVVPG